MIAIIIGSSIIVAVFVFFWSSLVARRNMLVGRQGTIFAYGYLVLKAGPDEEYVTSVMRGYQQALERVSQTSWYQIEACEEAVRHRDAVAAQLHEMISATPGARIVVEIYAEADRRMRKFPPLTLFYVWRLNVALRAFYKQLPHFQYEARTGDWNLEKLAESVALMDDDESFARELNRHGLLDKAGQ